MTKIARRAGALVAALAAMCVALAAPAHAADGISAVRATGNEVTATVTVTGLASGLPTADAVSATVDGQAVPVEVSNGTRTAVAAQARRSVVLLLDTSGSMAGEPIAAAIAAARRFVQALPADTAVGVATFSDHVHVIVAPSRDHADAAVALGGVTAGGETSLYDGVIAAARLLGASGDRSIVVLSDGADSVSKASLTAAAHAVRTSGVQVTAIAFGPSQDARRALDVLTAAGHGRVLGAPDAAGLARAFTATVQTFTTRLTVTAAVPPALRGHVVQLAVVVRTADGPVTLTSAASVPALPAAHASPPAHRSPAAATATPHPAADPRLRYGGAAAVGVGLLLLVLLGGGARERAVGRGAQARRLVHRYTLAPRPAPTLDEPTHLGTTPAMRRAVGLAGRLIGRRDYERRLALRLDRAGVTLRPAEWVLLQGAVAALALLLGVLGTGNLVVALGLAALLAGAAPRLVLAVRTGRRRAAFLAQLPDALTVVAGSLAAGYSLAQALDTVVREAAQPFAGEISRALAESRIGIPLEDALDEVAERMAVPDFPWVVMAVRTQREVGGNLSEILRTVATLLRERAQLRRHVRALSAEGRLSAYILTGLPIAMSGYLFAFRRAYLRPLYTTGMGLVMLTGAVLLVVMGALFMRKLVKVEV